jgi:hypothetical protein
MKFWTKSLLALTMVGGMTVGTVGVVRAAYPQNNGAAIGMAEEDFPNLRHALRDLRTARNTLDDLEPKYRGHRAKAIEHADAAIHEIEACLDEEGAHYDR